MVEKGQTTLQLEPEVKQMLNDTAKRLRVGQKKLTSACLLHGLLDLDLSKTGKVEFNR